MIDFSRPVAVISDVHSNLEALTAVLADIRTVGVSAIVSLGDAVGYGPDPVACVDILAKVCSVNLCGNHDFAVLNRAEGFNPVAKAAVDHVRAVMEPEAGCADADKLRRWRFLSTLLPVFEHGDYEFMHGSPRLPITEYVLPSDPELDPFKLDAIFASMSHPYAFVGHTHFPGVVEDGNDMFVMLDELPARTYVLHGRRAVINVGSVGQPRDNNAKACYAVLHRNRVTWRRVPYDIRKTVDKIRAQPKLDTASAVRLYAGR